MVECVDRREDGSSVHGQLSLMFTHLVTAACKFVDRSMCQQLFYKHKSLSFPCKATEISLQGCFFNFILLVIVLYKIFRKYANFQNDQPSKCLCQNCKRWFWVNRIYSSFWLCFYAALSMTGFLCLPCVSENDSVSLCVAQLPCGA